MKRLVYVTSICRFLSLHKNFSKLFMIFFLVFASTQLHADVIVTEVSVNDGSNFIPLGDTTASIKITAWITSAGGGDKSRWRSIAYIINGTCYSASVTNRGQGTYPYTLTTAQSRDFVTRLPTGKNNVIFYASGATSGSVCSSGTYVSAPFPIEIEKEGIAFDCNTLYGTTDSGQIFRYNNPAISTARTNMYKRNTNGAETIALGPFGAENGTLTMFNWSWDWSPAGVVEYVHNYSLPVNGQFTVSRPRSSGSFRYWSGGEVNQLTGQI
ncbi:MAG: hypothetical protein LBH45_06000, partial [Campylobacteraceae bacterium]|nr:hypothetical protein [Campylobacteraceae bacterium]